MLEIVDWLNALVHEKCIVGKIKREFAYETLVLNDGEWHRYPPGVVEITMQDFEFKGDVSIKSCMRHLNEVVANGVKQIPFGAFGGGTLFIRQPFSGDDDGARGRYGVVLRCK